MFKMSTIGWHTCLKSLVVVFHRVVNGFLQWGRPNQLKCILKLGNCFWLLLQLVIRLQHCPKPDNPVDCGQVNWSHLRIIGEEVKAIWLAETQNLNGEKDTPRKINAILWSIKINKLKLISMCGCKLATNQQNFTEI